MTANSVSIGILGATGYTGVELLRLLALHPSAEIACLTSERYAGQPIGAVFPHLAGDGVAKASFAVDDVLLVAGCVVDQRGQDHMQRAAEQQEVSVLLDDRLDVGEVRDGAAMAVRQSRRGGRNVGRDGDVRRHSLRLLYSMQAGEDSFSDEMRLEKAGNNYLPAEGSALVLVSRSSAVRSL